MNDTIERNESPTLIASDKVEGTSVYNNDGEHLGSISNFMVDKESGQVEYAVLQFGGVFGLGSDHYPLPWDMLTYDTQRGGYVVSVSRDQLEGAPRYGSDSPEFSNDYGRNVYGHYGMNYPYA